MPPGEPVNQFQRNHTTENPPLHGVILAGGRGTRFWPRSRRRRAKQVLAVMGHETLIQQKIGRASCRERV